MDRCRQGCNYGGKIRVWLLFSMRKEDVGGLQKVNPWAWARMGCLPWSQRPPKVAHHCSLTPTAPNPCPQGSTLENAAPALLATSNSLGLSASWRPPIC